MAWNDYLSSTLSNGVAGIHEANPFARNANMQFVLWKGIVVDLIFFVFLSAIAWVIYQLLKHLNVPLAKVCSAGLFAYLGYERLTEAVIRNYLYAVRILYVKASGGDAVFELLKVHR